MSPFWRHPNMEKLSRFLDEMLDEKNQKICKQHLTSCLPCRNLFEGMGRAKEILQSLPNLEEHPIQQLQPPLFIPVIRASLAPRLAAGFFLGALGIGFLLFHPTAVPMRVVSGPSVEGVPELRDMKLEPGVPLKSLLPGDVDLEIPNQVFLRLKPGATVTWQQFQRPWGRPKIVLNVMQGKILARTQKGFWGSIMEVRTPNANAIVKGTAFSVSVDPKTQTGTTLQVLAGSVFFSPYLKGVGVEVGSGQESSIQATGMPNRPRLVSPDERKALLETYRIGRQSLVELIIGSGPERVKELLQPTLLHLSFQEHPELHFYMRRLVSQLNAALLKDSLGSKADTLQALEISIENLQDPALFVPLRLFVGSCRVRLGQMKEGQAHFQWVADNVPQDPPGVVG